MSGRKLLFVAVLACCPVARGELVYLDLVPDRPGPYGPGEALTIDFNVLDTGLTGIFSPAVDECYLRGAGLDFSQSDTDLTFDSTFVFDLPMGGALYATFPALPYPSTAFIGVQPMPSQQATLPAGGSMHLGYVGVTLPSTPGTYLVDAVTPDPNGPGDPQDYGARFDFGHPTVFWFRKPEVSGGTLALEVIPEPATLALLVLGGIAAIRRRPR